MRGESENISAARDIEDWEDGILRDICRTTVWLLGLLLLGGPLASMATAQGDDVFDEFSRGLVGTYSDGTRTFSRIDQDLSFLWSNAPPLPELANGNFTAEWTGTLLVKSDTTYRFQAHAQGRVKVEIDGKTVLDAAGDQPGWLTGPPTALEFGFLPVRVTFAKTADQASLRLFWSSDLFPLEPVPAHLLFSEDDNTAIEQVERGRVLFDAYRCNRCHARPGDLPSEEAPPFLTIAADLSYDWILKKLQHQHDGVADSKMPSFGFQQEEAEAVAAWLYHIAQPPQFTAARGLDTPQNKRDTSPDGHTLLHSLGCLACHKVGELGQVGPHGGGDLSTIGLKRSTDWLHTWLHQPDRINPQRRMPTFKLTPTERTRLTQVLSTLGKKGKEEISFEPSPAARDTAIVAKGRELAKQARCFNCHRTPAHDFDTRGLSALNKPVDDWSKTCLAESPDRTTGRPHYPQADVEALKAYLEARRFHAADRRSLPQNSPHVTGQIVMERRNCLACHERDLHKGIVATAGETAGSVSKLRGLSEAMIPPNLTAVGDKLQDDALAEAVAGEQKSIRMPWLRVRMPVFKHDPEERAALVQYLIGHDRIPEGAIDAPDQNQPNEVDATTLLAGRSLVSVGGFSCIACHAVGEYEPRNVALGTRGSNLKDIGNRMRPEYFSRWTRAPLRVVPGMEMPSYDKPVVGVLDEKLPTQISALWHALNDPRFKAPTNPAQVEQLLAVAPGEAPRIVRDVFAVSSDNGGGYVPRALAVGFGNGHSLLFDLDTATVREWTYGDFARQRTEGKSWYWDLAGQPVVTGFPAQAKRSLGSPATTAAGDDSPPAEASTSRLVRPAEYRIVELSGGGQGIELRYSMLVSGTEYDFRETLLPWSGTDGQTGWQRRVAVQGKPAGASLSLHDADLTKLNALLPGAHIEVGTPDDTAQPATPADAVETYIARVGGIRPAPPPRQELPAREAAVTTAPGFVGQRLKLPSSIMPTALDWRADGKLVFTSLKGHVYVAGDSDNDGLEDTLTPFAEGLAAPFGILPDGNDLLIGHKPEVIRLIDRDGDGRAEEWKIVADGWGYSDNYHDWTTGPVRDAGGNLYIGLGSDYSQPGRPASASLWRGKMLKIASGSGKVTPYAHGLRYPMGIAFDARGRMFVSDQQGVQNTWNEIDEIKEGRFYGVPALHDEPAEAPETRAAVEVPHPMTRSINGVFFLPTDETPRSSADLSPQGTGPLDPARRRGLLQQFAGHGIGCEYNEKLLIRFSYQEVNGELQGAMYLFSRNTWSNEQDTFLGPICGGIGPDGSLYVGSIHDSGWLGGLNTGEIVRLTPQDDYPNGIRELRATPDGFEIEFLKPVDPKKARQKDAYSLSGATRIWKGSYGTEDSGQYRPNVTNITLSDDARTVRLKVDRLEPAYLYEVGIRGLTADGEELFPNTGYYTMNQVPGKSK